MEIRRERRFARDLRRVRSDQIQRRVRRKLEEMEAAPSLAQVRGVKKIADSENHYRVRVGDYRIGLEMDGEIAILQRFGARDGFYRGFP